MCVLLFVVGWRHALRSEWPLISSTFGVSGLSGGLSCGLFATCSIAARLPGEPQEAGPPDGSSCRQSATIFAPPPPIPSALPNSVKQAIYNITNTGNQK